MCGILAVFNKKLINDEVLSSVDDMLEVTKMRGPDNTAKIKINNRVLLGSNRLKIIDQSKNGNMPFQDHSKRYTIVFNGEIYNYQELRKRLEFKKFKSGNDTEILLYLLIEFGEKIIKDLNGMFAFVFYDSVTGKIIMARDRFGVKPFYYYFKNNNLIVNSDIKTFFCLKNQIDFKLDKRGLSSYINLRFIPAPLTIFKNIYKLEPAHYIVTSIDSLKIKLTKYWAPSDKLSNKSELVLKKEMITKIKEAVEDSLDKDSDIGVLLSGGLDSSAVYSIAKKTSCSVLPITCEYQLNRNKIKKEVKSENNLLIYEEQSELCYAKTMVDKFGDKLKIINICKEDIYKEFENYIMSLGEPMASTDALGHYLLAKNLPKNIKSYIVGTGVDEFLGGYIHLFLESGNFLKTKKTAHDFLYKFIDFDKNKLFTGILKKDLRSDKYLLSLVDEKMSGFKNFETRKEGLNYYMLFELFFDLPGWELAQTDSLYMNFSKEIRPVFLNNNFVDFCLSLPSELKFKNGHEKYLFKEALKKELPREIVMRKKLPSVGTPLALFNTRWFKNKFEKVLEDEFNLFDFKVIDYNNLNFDLKYRLVVVDTWMREVNKKFGLKLRAK